MLGLLVQLLFGVFKIIDAVIAFNRADLSSRVAWEASVRYWVQVTSSHPNLASSKTGSDRSISEGRLAFDELRGHLREREQFTFTMCLAQAALFRVPRE